MIKLVGVEKTLGQQPVLRGVDLTIPSGKLTTIIGRSGEGKSVLLKHIIGRMQPDRGEVWIDGTDIAHMKGQALNEVRKKFAMLFQGAALFDSLSVFENVAFPLREKLRLKGDTVTRRVEEKLEQVGLKGMGHKFPAELSGGMRKRAGLARALVMEPEIILFDEPTTGLDPLMAKAIHDLIVAMQHQFGDAVDRRRDAGHAARHGLHQHHRDAFGQAGQHEDVGLGKALAHLLPDATLEELPERRHAHHGRDPRVAHRAGDLRDRGRTRTPRRRCATAGIPGATC